MSTIHPNTFRNTNEYVKHFETSNTNLSELIFSTILNQFINLIDITMLNDSIKTIPSHAFRQRKLERLWLGMGYGLVGKQPLKSIAPYAFSYLPKLYFLQIATDYPIELHKYSFALETFCEYTFSFEMNFAGNGWSSNSFPLMSLTQFRSRQVFIRFYDTPNLKYLNESIFKPFFESDGLNRSAVDIAYSVGINREAENPCPCEMQWIQRDYIPGSSDLFIVPVYGYPCYEYDFRSCKNIES